MSRPEPLWRRYLRFFGPDVEADVDDELAHHMAMREAEYVARGLTPDQARAAARERFGDVETTRAQLRRQDRRRLTRANRARLLEELALDVRYGVRALWTHRGFAASAVLTLALGIGATTAMFSAVDAALLRPLPFAAPERLVSLSGINVPFDFPGGGPPSPIPDVRSVGAMTDQFSHVAAYAAGGLNLTGGDTPERVRIGAVTQPFFATLGLAPAQGRGFTEEEGRPGGPMVAVLSAALARRQFAAGAVVGRSVALNGRAYEVVGVMPAGFGFPDSSDLWIPLTVPMTFASFAPFRSYMPSRVVARLAPGATLEGAAARLRTAWQAIPEEMSPNYASDIAQPVAPLQRQLAGSRRTSLLVLLGATGLLLLIACANVTSLLLARAAVRRREFAVRAALGASLARLVRQLVVESLVLAVAGAAAGLVLAQASLGVVRTLMPAALGSVAPVALDWRVLGFSMALALVTAVVFGLWPAFGAARTDAADTMKSGGHGATRHGAGRLRRALVVGELAVALTLVAGAGLMLRSFRALVSLDPGFRPERVATLELALAQSARAGRLALLDGVIDRLGAVPGIQAAGAINDLPLRGPGGIALTVEPEGRPAPEGDRPYARLLQASSGYFTALGIRLVRGRLMTRSDDSLAPHVMVISETMARRYWPDEDPIGKRIVQRPNPGSLPGAVPAYRTVIGVVADVREGGLERDPTPQMYWPIDESPPTNAAVVVRGSLPARDLLAALRAAVREVDPRQPVYNVRSMEDVRSVSLAPRRTNTTLITAFGALALFLAMVGVYGVVAYSVTQRRRELGIRAALGATRADLVRLVMVEGGAMALAGVLLGMAGAWAFARALSSLLYGVEPTDLLTFVAAPLVLVVLAVAATLVPAGRAARLNPVDVIRAE